MIEQRRSNTGILLIIAAMLFASISLSAQQQPERNGPPKPPSAVEVNKMIDELSTTLSLNESQKKEVPDLFTAHFNNMKESMGSREGSGSPEEMQQKRKDFEAQVKSLLNDEQKLAFDQFMKSRGPQPNQQMPKR
ncbi:MAG: hypothetical protein IPJ23_13705 [Ignavibacteriales bacterium]|nr:hypothetical protein [Ignavibacteriales bacterium]